MINNDDHCACGRCLSYIALSCVIGRGAAGRSCFPEPDANVAYPEKERYLQVSLYIDKSKDLVIPSGGLSLQTL